VPKIPEVTENPEVQSHDCVRSIIFLLLLFLAFIVLFLYCLDYLLSRLTIWSTGLLELLCYSLVVLIPIVLPSYCTRLLYCPRPA